MLPNGKRIPLKVGDEMEINDNWSVVVGICRVTQTFQTNPVIYTTYSSATSFAPSQRLMLSFVTVKAKPGQDLHALCQRIERATGLRAYTRNEFKMVTFLYYLKYTGMPINFLTAVALGFIVGVAISGQTFYNFTLDNLRYFGTLKAMGATNGMLLRMILLQALVVGGIGYGLGVGAASAWGLLHRRAHATRLPTAVATAGNQRSRDAGHLPELGGTEHSQGNEAGARGGVPQLEL